MRYSPFDQGHKFAPLTVEVMASWLTGGVPPCETLIKAHGLASDLPVEEMWPRRNAAIATFGYAIPCKEAISAIAAASPLVEVGAGTGFWSALVTNAGGDILACDDQSGKYKFRHGDHFPVAKVDAVDFVRTFPERNVLAVWPSYGQSWAEDVARAMSPGRTLFLVSEGNGGAVADDGLFEDLDSDFEEIDDIELPVWPGMHDRLDIYRKKQER